MDVSQPIDQYVKRIQKPQTWGGAIGMFLYISCTDLMHGIVDVVQNSQYLPNSKSKNHYISDFAYQKPQLQD